ncbi:hypothetical protein SAMN05216266_10346 [Amycolatopsis marina]|uniref:Uncharacterized protein n=1 Tax=Amycolatopsis marina TaxID=490629 RepID=A0A1I0XC48_9PSEU|nr:hypothetical protein [Amycolatopsis marina]SFA97848.1 hypothetical protein SAMN05216266_10346 [Amycolatopsis marina]
MWWIRRLYPMSSRSADDLKAGYRPVVGGVRHRTCRSMDPPPGSVVGMLCGLIHEVGSRRKSPHVYDCSACEEVHAERGGWRVDNDGAVHD